MFGSGPSINNRLAGRLSVNVKEQGILLRRVEIGRLDAPGVQQYAIANIYTKEFCRTLLQLIQLGSKFRVVCQDLYGLVLRQANQLGNRRPVEGRVSVEGPL